jgi:hypothetical protein
MKINPEVWENTIFFSAYHSVLLPQNPSSVTKRKYYDLIQNTLFYPPAIQFGGVDKHIPQSPYLDNKRLVY